MKDTKPEVPEQEAAAAKEAEFQGRVKEFNAELMLLLKKYRLRIGAVARVVADPQLYDDTAGAAPAQPAPTKISEG